MKKKIFTVDEANSMLPLVRAIVTDIVTNYRDIHERRERLAKMRQRSSRKSGRDEGNLYAEEVEQMEEDIQQDIRKLEAYVDELEELGVELKDFVVGLVDFRARFEGREVYLCWKLGEPEIGYWHELDAGFRGRQSLFERSVSGGEIAGTEEA